ncbi:hypothetical protein [Halomonas lysinitropha]|uniref:Uncharacterized protein n=1 Tax=Halomonas lysinitropha TaxID=2607506 RepID=A0A5K1I7Q9_9GAMM|nr:hypothetical protein [Halomonas lysinitropha]VVZ96511.1 hypothetical protein HALO32_02612 [Halomonas lysinitropha]
MAEQMRQGFCRECNKYTLVKRRGVNHILHLLLSIFTLSLWVVVWVFLTLFHVGGWRCQACGSDQIKDTGEMLSLRGWIIIVFMAGFVLPLMIVMAGGDSGVSSMESITGILVWVPVLSIPVLIVMAVQHRNRKQERAQSNRAEVPQSMPAAPDTVYRPGDSPQAQPESAPPAGMIVSEETYERAETDQDAAAEFRRRMQQRDP